LTGGGLTGKKGTLFLRKLAVTRSEVDLIKTHLDPKSSIRNRTEARGKLI
jgi:hypothetical protein